MTEPSAIIMTTAIASPGGGHIDPGPVRADEQWISYADLAELCNRMGRFS
jgi:hypothetical protein